MKTTPIQEINKTSQRIPVPRRTLESLLTRSVMMTMGVEKRTPVPALQMAMTENG
jgi:hypothetical protein